VKIDFNARDVPPRYRPNPPAGLPVFTRHRVIIRDAQREQSGDVVLTLEWPDGAQRIERFALQSADAKLAAADLVRFDAYCTAAQCFLIPDLAGHAVTIETKPRGEDLPTEITQVLPAPNAKPPSVPPAAPSLAQAAIVPTNAQCGRSPAWVKPNPNAPPAHMLEPKADTPPPPPPGGRPAPPPTPRKRMATYSAADLQTVSFPPVSYIVPGIIPRGVTVLAGKPKCGKSWLALDIGWAVATGDSVLNSRPCEQGDVLYAALEDNKRRMQSRMSIQRPDQALPPRLRITHELAALDSGGEEDLRDWLKSQPKPSLVIVDVLSKVRPTQRKTEDKYQHDYRTMSCLNKLANEFNVGVLVLHHVRKLEAEDEFDTVSGTLGITGAADTIVIFKRTKSGQALIGRGGDVEEFDLPVQFGDDRRLKVLSGATAIQYSPQRAAILTAIESGRTSPQEISTFTGLGHDPVRSMLGQMVLAGEVERVGRGQYRKPTPGLLTS
jgi:hypothetical protein